MDEETMKDKIDNISIRTFTIGSCPETVYQRFKKYCERNAKNVRYFRDGDKVHTKEEIIYHLGLKMLLDIAETDAKTMLLYEKMKALEVELELLKGEKNAKKDEDTGRKKVKTFGA